MLRLDVPVRTTREAAFSLVRKASEIARGSAARMEGTAREPGVGITLASYSTLVGQIQEAGGARRYLDSEVVVPSGVLSIQMGGKTDYPGMGEDALLYADGDPVWQKQVAAGDDWDLPAYRLEDDEGVWVGASWSSWLGPVLAIGDTLVPLDRVWRTRDPHDGKESVVLRLDPRGSSFASATVIANQYFCAPASLTSKWIGSGDYQISYFGDGNAVLFERCRPKAGGTSEWRFRLRFQFAPRGAVAGRAHYITVVPHEYPFVKDGRRGCVVIKVASSGQSRSETTGGQSGLASLAGESDVAIYYVPADGYPDEPLPITIPQPLRLDMRRRMRAGFQVYRRSWMTQGDFYDDPIVFDGAVGLEPGKGVLYVTCLCARPQGTNVAVDLFALDGAGPYAPLARGELDSGRGVWASYQPQPGWRGAQARGRLTGPGTTSPVAEELRYHKNAVTALVAPGEFEATPLSTAGGQVQATMGTRDPSQENALVSIEDPGGVLTALHDRGVVTYSLETEYEDEAVDWEDPANWGKRSVLASGYATRVAATDKGRPWFAGHDDPRGEYGAEAWKRFDLECGGEWQRILAGLAPDLYDFSAPMDPQGDATGQAAKATDALKTVLSWMGYRNEQMYFPADLPNIRLWPASTDGVRVIKGGDLAELLASIAADYLSGWLVFDRNAATEEQGADPANWLGVWRLGQTPAPPYRNLAYFDKRPPGRSGALGWVTGHSLADFPKVEDAGGHPMVGAPIFGRPQTWVRPPEFNKLTVVGGAPMGQGPNGESPRRLGGTVFNFRSFDFLNAGSAVVGPDWIPFVKEAFVVNPALTTAFAVAFMLRRLIKSAGTGRRCERFTAPWVLATDEGDPIQRRPRPLRYGDPVLFRGAQRLAVSATLQPYRKDGFQMGLYETEEPPE